MEYSNIIKNFGILNRTFLRYVSKAILEKNISYSDSIFLVNIGNKEGSSQEEIAETLSIDAAAVARSVKCLQQKGYVKTDRSQNDKRVKTLYLSSSGKELYQFLKSLNDRWIQTVLQNLDEEEIAFFVKTIEKISGQAKTLNNDWDNTNTLLKIDN